MALTTRGKALIAGGAVVAVLGGGVAAFALTGNNPVTSALHVIPGVDDDPTPCPLTNQPVGEDKEPPARPALAVKVENSRSIVEFFSPGMREGWLSHRWAVALLAERIAVGAVSSLCSAEINPGGYRVSKAP